MENSDLDKILDMWKLNMNILVGLFVLASILDTTELQKSEEES